MRPTPNTATATWTAEDIRDRLGISTAIYQKRRLGAAEMAAIREQGIRRIELLVKQGSFDFEDRRQGDEVVGECQSQGIEIVAVHASLELELKSEDETIRAQAMDETLHTIRFAERIGASTLVAHFGWNETAERTVTELLDATDDLGMRLTTENMVSPIERYLPIVDAIASERFGLTLDIGHVRDEEGANPFTTKAGARRTLAQCGGRAVHLHLHETFDVEKHADHHPPMHPNGTVEWGEILAGLRRLGYRGTLLFEDGRGEEPGEWVEMTGAFPENFVRRYALPEDHQ
ncbi:MAG: sugar phosphate isomerase/epimerase family protein [Armatimonadota bacterium]|jgi:sugar phosphate isomerase/epimerase